MMTVLSTVPVDDAVRQLDFWSTLAWPMTEAEAVDQASGVGWTLEDDGRVYARNNPVSFQMVLGLSKRDVAVSEFQFSLTSDAPKQDPAALDLVKDAFSEFVAAGRKQWGKAALTRRGNPAVRWDLGERGGIRIYQDTAVVATFMAPEHVRVLKGLNDW